MSTKINGPKGSHPLSLFLEYRKNPLRFFGEQFKKFGNSWMMTILGKRVVVISQPNDVVKILRDHWQDVVKGRTTRKLKLLMGEGLITSEGEFWRNQNRLMRPVFNIKNIHTLIQSFENEIIQTVSAIKTQKEIDITVIMHELSLKIITSSLFHYDLGDRVHQFIKDVDYLQKFIISRTRSVINFPVSVPIKSHREFSQALNRFDDVIYELINQRKNTKANDLLQILLDSQDENEQKMSAKQVRDEIITILMAGHETIANSISWTVILLAQNQEIQNKARSEAKMILEAGWKVDNLLSKTYLQAVIEESMRVYPPVWAFMREIVNPFTLESGLEFKKGDNVVLVPYFTHRLDEFWTNSLKFDPDRFLSENKSPPGSYIPFGFGPRICIGQMFAQIEAKVIMSHFLSHFRFEIENVVPQDIDAGIVIKPLNNKIIKVTPC